MDQQMITDAFANLTAAINGMNIARAPPPMPFNGSGSIADFFRIYENYCESIYKEELGNYLLALPSFLEGEAKAIVAAFGNGEHITYEIVKEKLIAVFQKKALGASPHVNLWSAVRHPNESFTCFGVRLEALASKINSQDNDRKEMVRAKFMASLEPSLAKQLSVRFADNADATLQKMVTLATILEDNKPQRPKVINNIGNPWPEAEVEVTLDPDEDDELLPIGAIGGGQGWKNGNVGNFKGGVSYDKKFSHNSPHPFSQGFSKKDTNDPQVPKPSDADRKPPKCFGCGELGHFRPRCPNLTCSHCSLKGHSRENCRKLTQAQKEKPKDSGLALCTFCGEGKHVLMNCGLFKTQFLLCLVRLK